MKRLIFKELREHFKVALLGLAVLTVMLIVAFSASSSLLQRTAFSSGYSSAENFQPLLANALLTQATFFCAIFAALLGWLQIRAEKHPDLWAFLVHRPIARKTILHSKIVSGLLLYTVVAGLPLLGLILVVSIPGMVAAPFQWAMALPLVAIFLVGTVYYLAGLLTGLRKARWYGSRVFGLGPAVVATFGLFTVPDFWHALLIIVAAATILMWAVSGSFKTGGHYRGQPVPGKLSLILASTVSVTLLLGVMLSLVINLLWSRDRYVYSHYQLTRDGKVIKITQRGFDQAEIVDLEGNPVLDEKTGQKIKPKEMQHRYAMGLSASVNFNRQDRKRNWPRERYSSSGRFFHPWRVLDKELWYLTSDGRLVAYHGITRKVTASLKPLNNPGAPDDSRFNLPANVNFASFQPYEIPELLASARTAYLVDLEKRELKSVLSVTNGDAIGGFSQNASRFSPASSNLMLILTRTSVRLLDFEGATRLHIPYEPAYPAYSSVSVLRLELTNAYAVRFEPDHFENQKLGGTLTTQVKWVGRDGNVRNAMTLPKLPDPRLDTAMEKYVLVLAPPAVPFYSWEEQYRVAHFLRLVPALLCVGIGWWLGRRNNLALSARIGWGLFHFLFGLPGLLAFLAVQEWPAREPCPRCRKSRVVNREQCEHCGAEFDPPARTGIEIFEPLATH